MKLIGKILLVIAFAALLDFILLNWMMGCESWDREQWTAEHSCVVPWR